jgi:hypothetical protein
VTDSFRNSSHQEVKKELVLIQPVNPGTILLLSRLVESDHFCVQGDLSGPVKWLMTDQTDQIAAIDALQQRARIISSAGPVSLVK